MTKKPVILTMTEYKELRRRLSSLLSWYGHIPESPPHPKGSQGYQVQKIRELFKRLDARLKVNQ